MDLFTAKKLTNLRKYYSLSQETLAEKTGVSRQAVSKWERGEASPSSDNLLTLSKLYNVSIDDLLGEKDFEEIKAQIENKDIGKNNDETTQTLDTQEDATKVDNAQNGKKQPLYSETIGDSEKKRANFSKEKISKKGRKRKEPKEKEPPFIPNVGKNLLKFPYFFVAALIYIYLGYVHNMWHPGWLIFVTIPAYYLTAQAFFATTKKKLLMRLPIYYYSIMLYMFAGIFNNLWSKAWFLFLLVPLYYWACSLLKNDE